MPRTPSAKKVEKIASRRTPSPRVTHAVVGPHTIFDESGRIVKAASTGKETPVRRISKMAYLGESIDAGNTISDSNNMGFYNFEFPVDALEMPMSRLAELKYYRLAYDRDPIVNRAINLHTELPLSKLVLERPKSSSPLYSEFIYDFYMRMVARIDLYQAMLHASRDYFMLGEGYVFFEDEEVEICDMARKAIDGKIGEGSPLPETLNAPTGTDEMTLMSWVKPEKFSSLRDVTASLKPNKDGHITLEGIEASILEDEKNISRMRLAAKTASNKVAEATELDSDSIQSLVANSEVDQLQRLLTLLERKRELLEEIKAVKENREHEYELFKHLVNPTYQGVKAVKLIPPDTIEIKRGGLFTNGPKIFYKPSASQKAAYLNDESLDSKVKEHLTETGQVPLSEDPTERSWVVQYARKKALYEDHGRSAIQPVLRSVIYRDKLRQVQTTLASRSMTPLTLVIAPGVSGTLLGDLRNQIDEAKADPDFAIMVNFDMTYQSFGAEGRLLSLDAEWQHTNNDLSVGLGFSPDILLGEGMYGQNRVNLELLHSTYTLYRDTTAQVYEEKLFKPVAWKKGFYELDKFGTPRWLYPKITFSRLALRDQGDVYEMLYNLYVKGSLPVDIIYEFLNLDPEACKTALEQDVFTVKDSKFNELLGSLYSSIADTLITDTNIVDKIITGITLSRVAKSKEESEAQQ